MLCKHKVRAGLSKADGNGAPDSLRRSCDDRDPVFQSKA